ncbi:hypothetical protein [uncultured Streptomyces sp.]|uniref:hypothetical protein n=1 Tax=uncultured Streptomyces sp. TaxID=174707 RepID=UPI0026066C07|nr:hypothetical protein [uncultured Streptomyces sp.]
MNAPTPENTPRHDPQHDADGAPDGPASPPPEDQVRPDSPGPDARTPRPPLPRRQARFDPGPGPAGCAVCLDYDLAEEEAESAGDLSRATDWRVLRTRHRAADH